MIQARWTFVWLLSLAGACSEDKPAHSLALDGAVLQPALDGGVDARHADVTSAHSTEASTPRPAQPNPGVITLGDPSLHPAPECAWTPPTCNGRAQVVDLTGETPYGPIHVRSVGVSYWIGFTYETRFRAEGTLGGLPMVFEARIADAAEDGMLSPVIAPGRYQNGPDWTALFARVLTCQNDIPFAQSELIVERHDGPLSDAGVPLRVSGEFVVSDPGWSLRIPFDVRELCSVSAI